MTDYAKMKHPVNVVTVDLSVSKVTSVKIIDHDNSSDRLWLLNHTFWAMRNGHGVAVNPFPAFKKSKELGGDAQ